MELINARLVEDIKWGPKGHCRGYFVVGTTLVEAIGNVNNVMVYYTYDNEKWNHAKGKYLRSLANGKELWCFETPLNLISSSYEDCFCRFVIKLEVEGEEYWDNNGGKEYYLCRNYQLNNSYNSRYVLGKINVSLVDSGRGFDYTKNKDYIVGNILVRNLDYNKDVKVRYTIDNWFTFKEKEAYYQELNSDNIEIWSFVLEDIPQGAKVQFCIYYSVANRIYWDNNFGHNYER